MALTIVGEAGSCHEGSLQKALDLVEVAAKAKCSYVKAQFWSDPAAMRARRRVADPAAYEQGSIEPHWLPVLRTAAEDQGLQFACTVYLTEDVPLVARYVDAFKVASFEALDSALIGAIEGARGTRRLFISTGMCTQAEVDAAGFALLDATVLHCVSAYDPCPIAEANLGAIEPGGGYSDHTRQALTGGLAVAAGANTLEVHYRLDDTAPTCPDYCVALSPADLEVYTAFARHAYAARGDGIKAPRAVEQAMLAYRVIG